MLSPFFDLYVTISFAVGKHPLSFSLSLFLSLCSCAPPKRKKKKKKRMEEHSAVVIVVRSLFFAGGSASVLVGVSARVPARLRRRVKKMKIEHFPLLTLLTKTKNELVSPHTKKGGMK